MNNHNNDQTQDTGSIPVRVVSMPSTGNGIDDIIFIDDTNTTFIYRDNGATPPVFTAYTLPAAGGTGVAYTVGANPRPYAAKNVVVSSSALPTGAALETGNLAALLAKVEAGQYSITQTVVAVTGVDQVLIAANAARKYLAWMVVGTADVTITAGAAAAVNGIGFVFQSNGAGKQGGSEEFPHGAPTNAFHVIAAGAGSSVYVWEGA